MAQQMNNFERRLENVRLSMAADSLMVIPAQESKIRNRDTHFPYRGHSHTLYLTGVNEEELALIITHDELHIFAQGRNAERERWVGRVRGHEYFTSLYANITGKVVLHEASDFVKTFPSLAKGKKILYYDFGERLDYDRKFMAALNEIANFSRKGIFAPRTITRASEILSECRLFKDAGDIEAMREAARISVDAHNQVREIIQNATGSVSELALKAQIENLFMTGGASRLAYPSIVAAHDNATVLHYEGVEGRAKTGELILIDAGAEYQGYASDITRTTCVGGTMPVLKRDLYALVLDAQQIAISKSVAGESLESLHLGAIDILSQGLLDMGFFNSVPKRHKDPKTEKIDEVEEKTLVRLNSLDEVKELEYYNLFYMHKTSHYLGLDVHDVGDYYKDKESRHLEKGMVITVEPGLYFPMEYEFLSAEARGIGIRIEDDVLITEISNEVLTAGAHK